MCDSLGVPGHVKCGVITRATKPLRVGVQHLQGTGCTHMHLLLVSYLYGGKLPGTTRAKALLCICCNTSQPGFQAVCTLAIQSRRPCPRRYDQVLLCDLYVCIFAPYAPPSFPLTCDPHPTGRQGTRALLSSPPTACCTAILFLFSRSVNRPRRWATWGCSQGSVQLCWGSAAPCWLLVMSQTSILPPCMHSVLGRTRFQAAGVSVCMCPNCSKTAMLAAFLALLPPALPPAPRVSPPPLTGGQCEPAGGPGCGAGRHERLPGPAQTGA
jgi:hypothetical protein